MFMNLIDLSLYSGDNTAETAKIFFQIHGNLSLSQLKHSRMKNEVITLLKKCPKSYRRLIDRMYNKN